MGSVPVVWVHMSFFPRSDWRRVIRDRGEHVRGILGCVDDESVELGRTMNEDAENEVVDPDNATCDETVNPKRMKCKRAVVKDKEFE